MFGYFLEYYKIIKHLLLKQTIAIIKISVECSRSGHVLSPDLF
jgi:hypothetical protein